MQKITTYLLFVFFLLNVNHLFGQPAQKRILVIYSYDATFHIYQKSEKALHDVFPASDYIIDIEFLDSKRYPQRQLNQNVYDRIQIKQNSQSRYNIVIACNDNALNFCIDYQHQLFDQTPIIFWGVNDLEKAYAQDKNDWISGITENISLENTLELIHQLHPNKRKLHVITDNTTTGKADYKVFKQKITLFPMFSYATINASELNLQHYIQKLRQIPSNEIVLLISSYRVKDTYLGLDQINDLLNTNVKGIVYYVYDQGVGHGYAGGTTIYYYDHMYSACLIAKQVLSGTSSKYMKVRPNIPPENIVDYNILKKRGIGLKDIPENVIILNKPTSKIEIGRVELLKITSIIVTLFLILFLMIYLINSKRKREKSYRIFAENYLNIFNENHSMMLLINATSQQITHANKAASLFYGHTQENIKKMYLKDICQLPQIDIDAFFIQSMKQNSHFEQKHKISNGQIKDVEIHSGKIIIDKVAYIYVIIHDISKRIQAEQELIDAKKRAEESDRLKSAFLANMSHEIRTPMNSILGFSSLLNDQEADEKMRSEFIRHIHTSGEHLLTLINDIIDLSKIEANQLKVTKTECNLNQLLNDIFLIFKNQIDNSKKKHIALSLKIGTTTPDFIINTDQIRLKQILLNLLGNALKFTDNGTIEFGYKYREDSVIQFFVKDTGIGIPPNKQKEIFSAFQQIEEYASRNHGGTGLGLSITRSLVEKLGGHIWVMSEEGEGARFYFTHPGNSNRLNL